MSIDPAVLKRLLYLKINVEGNSSWVFRELIDYILEILEERLSLLLNEVVEPYGLEASVLSKNGCDIFPNEKNCENIIVAGVYEKDSRDPLVYAGYMISRGENLLEVKLIKVIDSLTSEPI
ncbi:MAG: hypothetical protein QXE81_03790 [Desulfurococcaceae archaeon]